MSPLDGDVVILPASAPNETCVTISALDGGHLTLPEKLFVTDASPDKRSTVPSLAFLIQHPSANSKTTKIVFDLGLKRDFSGYRDAQQHHISQRQPTTTSPDVADSLREGGSSPEDIDVVILSHVHWDHVGTSSDFKNAQFVVGSGTLHLLAHGGGPLYPANIFNPDELPVARTRELPPSTASDPATAANEQTNHQWKSKFGFPEVIDYFGDGSMYIIDAPGHLFGHVNILARLGTDRYVYLGGDCCHDPRILKGEKGIAMYDDGSGGLRSVHANTPEAQRTVKGIARLLRVGKVKNENGQNVNVEVVVAHDKEWREKNKKRFWPGYL